MQTRQLAAATSPGRSMMTASEVKTASNAGHLWKQSLRLPPGPRTILQMKALIVSPTTKTAFLECLG